MNLIIHQFKRITINRLSSKISSTYKDIREISDKDKNGSDESTKSNEKNQMRNKFIQDIDIKA